MLYIAAWYLLLSLITFIVYGIDKRKAANGTWRTKESTLRLLELLGGWPGAFAAQRIFHHKSAKLKFQIVYWLIVTAHLVGWGVWIFIRANT